MKVIMDLQWKMCDLINALTSTFTLCTSRCLKRCDVYPLLAFHTASSVLFFLSLVFEMSQQTKTAPPGFLSNKCQHQERLPFFFLEDLITRKSAFMKT